MTLICFTLKEIYNILRKLSIGNSVKLMHGFVQTIVKTPFVIFHPCQKKINYSMKIEINGKTINQSKSAKYLGILIDCHLNWKDHIQQIYKKISRGIGVLEKLRIMLMSKF